MNLLVISGMPHHLDADRVVYGWGPTVEELDHLATCFSDVHHVALLHQGPPPPNALPYRARNLTTTLLPAAGGKRPIDKLALLGMAPPYVYAIARELRRRRPDAVHIRCPANVPLLALPLVRLLHRGPCWVKYAGNWKATNDPLSYRLQRRWLRSPRCRCVVTVNGDWSDSPQHVVGFLNPSLTEHDLAAARAPETGDRPRSPFRLLFVGRVERAKGVDVVLEVARLLAEDEVDYRLEIVGDGAEKASFERRSQKPGLAGRVAFVGWMSKEEVTERYRRAHVVLLPSESEGWPKVLSEAMAYGAVPVARAVSAIPQVLDSTGAGFAVAGGDARAYYRVVKQLIEDRVVWRRASDAGRRSAPQFGYASYLSSVHDLFVKAWDVDLGCSG